MITGTMPTRTFILLLTLVFLTDLCTAQINDSIITTINNRCQHIHNNRQNFDTTVTQLTGSAEGGEAIAYYQNSNLLLIETVYFGEMAKTEMEYYFYCDTLLFILEKHYKYNRPIYWDSLRMAEAKDTVIYDPAKTTVTEDRYYFNQGELILWLDPARQPVDLFSGTNTLVGKGLKAHVVTITEQLRK